ncbi:hypothetical protein [Clostridium sp. ATCC 25772]|uniref:hypothetical protein n=1 Tax=Clostridium sp. ATCC 25772 TaxID=1676991 RepID=UPI000B28A79D|nr:hypothetical protein [Clostridium sp. ATCC 25772]
MNGKNIKILSEDKLVQMTQYGENLKVIINFSTNEATVEGNKMPAKSLLIIDENNKVSYTL